MSSDKYLDYKRIVKIIVGNLLITSAYAFITVPNEIVNGGVTSFSMILSNMADVNITIYTNTITVILLLLYGLFLGKQFFSGSILSCIAYMIFYFTEKNRY
ncbi:YitT family protein [Peptacetobacter hominis]|nr:YitT family protein [Peptacetobacter hominis]